MIAKITRGADVGGLVRYLVGPGKANEHTDARVIAASDGLAVSHGSPLDRAERQGLVEQLDGPRLGHGVEVRGGHVWHLSLTNRADDRPLSDEDWAAAVRTAMADLGFDDGQVDGRAPAPWVAIRHGQSQAGHEHVHVAVSLVREDGTRASTWRDRVKVSATCHKLEQRFGLEVVEGRTAGAVPVPSRAEHEIAARRAAPEPDRALLARLVRGAAAASRDEGEFVTRLGHAGVASRPRYAPGDRSRVVGYSVAVRGPERPIWFGGGRLGRDLSLPALRATWRPVEDQADAWRSTGRPSGREDRPVPADAWGEAARRVAGVTERLGDVDPADPAQWAVVARDGAGALAALSTRLEQDQPGPIAAAAAVMARSAQARPGQAPTGPALAGVATVAAQAALAARGGALGWVTLMTELVRLAEALGRLHRARGEPARTAELRQHTRDLPAVAARHRPRPAVHVARPRDPRRDRDRER